MALSIALPLRAAGPIGVDGEAITTSEYTIDLHRGPVLAGTRVVGLAGGYVAIAEGVAGYTVMTSEQIRAVVDRARLAQQAWAQLSLEERAERLLRFRDAIVEHADELCELLARENGKPRNEAMLHEVAVSADLITYYAKEAPAILAPEERTLHLFKHRRSIVTYAPRGVIGIIGPWNFPMQLPLRDVITAVMAGNAAVVKPSEVTPLIMVKLKELWDGCGMPEDLLGVVTGLGAAGAALVDGGINMCVLTGSVATGKRVAAACGERLIPCVMELGGKAALIACADCDVERTAQAIVMGGFANSGQICVSVERVYAHRDIHDVLLDRVVALTRGLRSGQPATEFCDIGGMTFAAQVRTVQAHIDDALSKGARMRCGGRRSDSAELGYEPTVLDNCDHSCTVMTEEIFGPIVPFMKVSSEEEALQLANDSHLGLNAYVFTEDSERGRRIAERVEAGSVVINDVLLNGAIAEAPFGGVKQSGFGRVLGPEGLRAMTQPRHLCLERIKMPAGGALGFPYTDRKYAWFRKGLRALYGPGSFFKRIKALF